MKQGKADQGLYRQAFEHDACGIGVLAQIKGVKSHQMLQDALSVLINMEHRGGKGLEDNTGDGAGILFSDSSPLFSPGSANRDICFRTRANTALR